VIIGLLMNNLVSGMGIGLALGIAWNGRWTACELR
jgi:hypothetical protein